MTVFVLSQSTMFQECATAGSARLTTPMKSCTDPTHSTYPPRTQVASMCRDNIIPASNPNISLERARLVSEDQGKECPVSFAARGKYPALSMCPSTFRTSLNKTIALVKYNIKTYVDTYIAPNIVPGVIADCTVTYIGLLSFTSEHVGSGVRSRVSPASSSRMPFFSGSALVWPVGIGSSLT
jgi:hypothetical protein